MGYFDHIETAAKLKKEEGDPCWPGYCQRGTKMKDGKEVPNCVPIETAAETFTPPPAVAKAAKRGIELRKAGGNKAGTPVGAGRASQLAARKPVSLAIVKKMKAYFDRHQVDKKGKDWSNREKPSKGKIMWLCWGGDAGYSWAKGILRKAEHANVETASLVDAISDLAEAIREGVTPADAVKEVAEEYGLNPVLLRRKFEEQHKASPEDYATKSAETKQNKVMLADAPLRDAQNTAREQYQMGFRPGGPGAKLVGRPFEFKGEQYVFVAVTNASYPVVAVRVRGNQPMNLKGNIQAIMDQVRVETAGDDKGDDKGGGEDKEGNLHVQQHHLTNNIFIRRAKQQADQLGLHWEGAFDPNGVPGLGRHNIRVSGQAEALEAFKNWCKGNMPKEDVDIETKEIAAMKPTVGDVLKSMKAETAAPGGGFLLRIRPILQNLADVAPGELEKDEIEEAMVDIAGELPVDTNGSDRQFHNAIASAMKTVANDPTCKAALKKITKMHGKSVVDTIMDGHGVVYGGGKPPRKKGRGEKASVADVLATMRGETAASKDWWGSMTTAQQKAYIKRHPRSKFAKMAGATKPTAKTKMAGDGTGESKTVKYRSHNYKKREDETLELPLADKRVVDKLAKQARKGTGPGYDNLEKMRQDKTVNMATRRYIRDILSDIDDEDGDND